jgi:hypothetical protein
MKKPGPAGNYSADIFNTFIFPYWLRRIDFGPEADIDDRIRFR